MSWPLKFVSESMKHCTIIATGLSTSVILFVLIWSKEFVIVTYFVWVTTTLCFAACLTNYWEVLPCLRTITTWKDKRLFTIFDLIYFFQNLKIASRFLIQKLRFAKAKFYSDSLPLQPSKIKKSLFIGLLSSFQVSSHW